MNSLFRKLPFFIKYVKAKVAKFWQGYPLIIEGGAEGVLTDYEISGNVADETDKSPTNPQPVGVGDYDEATGKYKIGILVDGNPAGTVYLSQPLVGSMIDGSPSGDAIGFTWGEKQSMAYSKIRITSSHVTGCVRGLVSCTNFFTATEGTVNNSLPSYSEHFKSQFPKPATSSAVATGCITTIGRHLYFKHLIFANMSLDNAKQWFDDNEIYAYVYKGNNEIDVEMPEIEIPGDCEITVDTTTKPIYMAGYQK